MPRTPKADKADPPAKATAVGDPPKASAKANSRQASFDWL